MKKALMFAALAMVFALAPLKQAYAASPSVYVSVSSSSVSVGSTFTATVGVNSNGKTYDTLEATLNYTGSKVSYVSHSLSSGVFATEQNNSGSSFNFTGSILGGTTSSRTFFTVKFKAKASGTVSLGLSGVRVFNAGASYSGVGTSGNSVAIKGSSTGGSAPKEDTSDGSTPTFSPEPSDEDTEAPKIKGKVDTKKTQSTITLSFKTNEKAKTKLTYTLNNKSKSVSSDSLAASHEVVLGKDSALEPGQIYTIVIRLTDKENNSAKVKTLEVRTLGVDYEVKISDKNGQPLVNHPVTLHSDPIETTTDKDGIARFSDVTPGEHTLVFEIDGLTLRQPVKVGQSVGTAGSGDSTGEVMLPVSFADIEPYRPQTIIRTNWALVLLAAGVGAALAMLIKPKSFNKLKKKIKYKAKRVKASHHMPEIIKPSKKK